MLNQIDTIASVILLGSVIYDLLYVPLRTVVFLVIVSIWFNISFAASGYVPALVILMAFIPFVWGIGSIAAACVLTFRRGSGVLGLARFCSRSRRAPLPAQPVPVVGGDAGEAEPDRGRHRRHARAVDW